MKRILSGLMALAAATAPLTAQASSSEALISFHGADNGSWERRAAVQDLLRDHYGFDQVRVLVDATAAEVPKEVRRFLEKPARPGDQRFVWVSGLKGEAGKTVCPGPAAAPMRPSASTLVLAPDCYKPVIRFPQGARHYRLSAPAPGAAAARVGRIDARDPGLVALITLPVGDDRYVAGADSLIFDSLKAGGKAGIVDPTYLLRALRAGFRWNGTAYTPTLDLFYGGAHEAVGPFGFRSDQTGAALLERVRPVKRKAGRKAGRLRVHDSPDPHTAAALTVRKPGPVRVLRADRSGAMRYVAIGDNLFGWVRRHDLHL